MTGRVIIGVCTLAMLAGGGLAIADALGSQEPASVPGAEPATPPPPQGLARWFAPASAPFIPIPEIDTEPHSGLTLGIIPTQLSTNARGEIERITAPDVIHSQYFGWGSRLRIFDYPSEDRQWSVVGGLKQRVEREFDASYIEGQTRAEAFSWSAEAIYDRSGIPRFFGIGNQSRFANQTNYLDNQGLLDVSVGRNFTSALQLAYLAARALRGRAARRASRPALDWYPVSRVEGHRQRA